MPETVKEVQSPYGGDTWVQVRIRIPANDWDAVRKLADGHTESWIRTAIRRQLDSAARQT